MFGKYLLKKSSGVVLEEKSRSETRVSGHIAPTHPTYGGGGGSISSSVTNYQNIYLKRDDGNEMAINLKNLLVNCRVDHELTAYQLTKDGDKGDWVLIVNNTTNEMFPADSKDIHVTFPVIFWLVSSIALALLVIFDDREFGFATLLVIVMLAGLMAGIGQWISRLRGSSAIKKAMKWHGSAASI
jgi:hypothetical protein